MGHRDTRRVNVNQGHSSRAADISSHGSTFGGPHNAYILDGKTCIEVHNASAGSLQQVVDQHPLRNLLQELSR